MKLTERYFCGHLRTVKGKHVCPACLAQRRAAKHQHVPMAIVAAKRRQAATARIQVVLEGLRQGLSLAEIGAKLGVSRQRVFQLLRWWEQQASEQKAEAG